MRALLALLFEVAKRSPRGPELDAAVEVLDRNAKVPISDDGFFDLASCKVSLKSATISTMTMWYVETKRRCYTRLEIICYGCCMMRGTMILSQCFLNLQSTFHSPPMRRVQHASPQLFRRQMWLETPRYRCGYYCKGRSPPNNDDQRVKRFRGRRVRAGLLIPTISLPH